MVVPLFLSSEGTIPVAILSSGLRALTVSAHAAVHFRFGHFVLIVLDTVIPIVIGADVADFAAVSRLSIRQSYVAIYAVHLPSPG